MFNDPIAVQTFKRLVKEFNIKTFIETGTDKGQGAYQASLIVPHVETIEIDRLRFFESLKTIQKVTNIKPWHGNSPEILLFLGSCTLEHRVCFYLDAHGGEYWPLLDELRSISRGKHCDCVIIIHDFKVPGKPWGYDSYGGKDLDIDYVREALAAINPNFKIFYNEEAEGNKRGIMYATP